MNQTGAESTASDASSSADRLVASLARSYLSSHGGGGAARLPVAGDSCGDADNAGATQQHQVSRARTLGKYVRVDLSGGRSMLEVWYGPRWGVAMTRDSAGVMRVFPTLARAARHLRGRRCPGAAPVEKI